MENKTLGWLADEFVHYKRSNGYDYLNGAYYLEKYVAFAEKLAPDINIPVKETVAAFMDKHISVQGSLYNLVATIREFSRYLTNRGFHGAYLIPAKKVSLPTPVKPYFFSEDEINIFFKACDNVTIISNLKGRHLVIPAMYRVIYCCGLRCKEVRTLTCKNVYLDKQYLDVIQSKGPKSRRIYISEELTKYLKSYDRKISAIFPDRRIFFPSNGDKPYCAAMLTKNFQRIWYGAFPEKKESGISVRAYDFRHHFVYANMNKWLREGKDVNAMLPYLMKYMGHSEVKNTLYYFHLIPDIYGAITEKSIPLENLIPEVCDEKE
jgi:integrase